MSRYRLVVPTLVFLLVAFATPALAEVAASANADATAVRSTKVHMPGQGYVAKYYCFSKLYPQGTPAKQGTATSGADSTFLVDQLLHISGDTYTYFDQINIVFVPENGAANILDRGDLASMLVLRPAENVADRALEYTPNCNPYWVQMLEERRANQRFWIEQYDVWTGSIDIELNTDPKKSPAYSSSKNRMFMPEDPAWFQDPQHPSLAYAIGHEMTHYAQTLAGKPVGDGFNHFHDGCMSNTPEASFGEGFADNIGSEYTAWRYGFNPDADYAPCWKKTYFYKKAEVVGPNYEDNNAAFLRSLTKRDRKKFWNTFTTARVALATSETRPIEDGIEMLMAVNGGKKLLPDRWIANPVQPAVFPEADSLWQYWVNGVEPAVLALNTGDSNNAGGWERDEHAWISSAYPNPARGNFYLKVRAPSSGAIQIALYDVRGRRVHVQTFTGLAIGEYRLTITPPSLPSGIYIVQYSDPVNGWVTSTTKIALVR